MLLNLLHRRLKFSIRDDALLVMLLAAFFCTTYHVDVTRANETAASEAASAAASAAEATTKSSVRLSRGLPPLWYVHDLNAGNDVYETIHRILRDEETTYRNENVRWQHLPSSTSRLDAARERRIRRNVANGDDVTTTINSTKNLNFSNRQLLDINFFSHIDVNISYSTYMKVNGTIYRDILVLNLSNNSIELVNDNVTQNITKKFLAQVHHLDLSNNRITDFSIGVDFPLTELVVLNLSGNRLTSFRSDHIPNVNVLDLSANAFTTPTQLHLNYLNDLQRVDLSCNQFNELHQTLFQNTTNLKVLNVACNRLTRIWKNYFFNLINVEILQLSHNNITEIENDTFVYLPNLQYLDLSYNRIDATSIRALQGIPDLIGLSLAYNGRLGNALQGFVASWSLKELDASGTGLCQIPAALAQSVHTLNISDNHFQVSFSVYFLLRMYICFEQITLIISIAVIIILFRR